MGRGPKPAKSKEAKPSAARKSPKSDGARVRDLEKRLAEALKDKADTQGQLQTSNRALAETREQQTATAEILRVISQSPTDVQPVFDAIVRSAQRLLAAYSTGVFRRVGDEVHVAAYTTTDVKGDAELRSQFPMPLSVMTSGNPILTQVWTAGGIQHDPDIESDPRLPERVRRLARARGFRSRLVLPLRREELVIGLLSVTRREPGGFSDEEIALLKTFAGQAVIAIENVRLFNGTKEALEQQTATAEILRVISSSPTDIQPVLDAVAQAATGLCNAHDAWVGQLNGDLLRVVAHHGSIPVPVGDVVPAIRGTVTGRSVIDRRTVHVADLQEAAAEYPEGSELAQRIGFRTALSVPLLREGLPIGVIHVRRYEVRPLTDKQIALLQTFADQAVIAIENVRLFKELQARNHDLTVALDQQTATAEILRVISGAPTDLQPVFDAIVDSVMRLFRPWSANVCQFDGELIHLVASRGGSSEANRSIRARFPTRPTAGLTLGRCILDRAVIEIHDVETDAGLIAATREMARARGWRSALAVPMLRDGEPVGAIMVTRIESGRFESGSVELLQTFADQAVIAIENVRLFQELQARTQDLTRSVSELRALGEVGQAISSTLDLQTVLGTIVGRAVQLSETDAGVIYEYDEQREVFLPRATEHLESEIVETMLAAPVRKGEGATGRLAEAQEPIQVPDILAGPGESRVRGALVRAGYRALMAVPLVREGHLIGGLTVIRKVAGTFASEVVELLQTFATQSSMAIQNARLFREIEEKSRQLEVASQHKSEFLANMSHELRTPLNAIIGFSEVLAEKMFGELNEKQEEYSKDIHASGQHLLSLINDILDLSKIEAGRMELELSDFHLPTALDSALTLVRERAGRRALTLHTSIDRQLGEMKADERKIRQVVLNLLSNAIKFTPEGGRIEVAAISKDGWAEVSVSDTGVGIAPEDQEKVFEEFRQVGTADKKVEGTGLGLTLCRKFVELHGGRIWVKSELGKGSTFTFTIPVRQGE